MTTLADIAVSSSPYHPEGFDDDLTSRLAGLCIGLQGQAGPSTFYLTTRAAAHVLQADRKAIGRRLAKLVKAGLLEEVVKGSRDVSSLWRWLTPCSI